MANLIVSGIILGSIITLGAVGLTLLYGIVNFANFAHGDMMTLGAYIALFLTASLFPALGIVDTPIGPLSFGWVTLISFIPAMIITGGVAILADRLVYRRLRNLRVRAIMLGIASLAVAFVMRSIIFIVWGSDFHFYSQGLRNSWKLPLGINLRPDQLVILVLAWAMVIALYAFLQGTKTGKALRAMADNRDLARVSGIATERMITLTWFIGGAMAAAAGILIGIDSQLRPEMGWILLLPLFAAVILGGIGNAYGALVGGLILGVAQQVSTAFLLPSYKPAVAFIIMILVLLVRPQGIFGGGKS
jgi:branched-chain amino acid transport system permease protein/neutral amino acid transport system permease protein